MRIAGAYDLGFFCCFGEGNFLFIYFSLKGEVRISKERTKRGITYINILHTLQKVERKITWQCSENFIFYFLFYKNAET